jgi:hypothetical protein
MPRRRAQSIISSCSSFLTTQVAGVIVMGRIRAVCVRGVNRLDILCRVGGVRERAFRRGLDD